MRSCGTDIVCGCHLLRCSFNILYFLLLDNELFIILYNIIKTCWVRLLLNYNIKYVFTICTRLNTCLMSISRFPLRDKVPLRLLKLHLYGADVVEWSTALDIRFNDCFCNVSIVCVHIPWRKEHNFDSSKNIMLTLLGLIFRRIYNI